MSVQAAPPLLSLTAAQSWVAGHMLSVLNTNSHELEELGGSGLFPLACLMEHSCSPNCAFSESTSTTMTVTIRSSSHDSLDRDKGLTFHLGQARTAVGCACVRWCPSSRARRWPSTTATTPTGPHWSGR